MSADASPDVREMVAAVYRAESRRVLATLIRLLGDFDLAEFRRQSASRGRTPRVTCPLQLPHFPLSTRRPNRCPQNEYPTDFTA